MPPKRQMTSGDWAQWAVVAIAIIGGALEAGKIIQKQDDCNKKIDALTERFDRFVGMPRMAVTQTNANFGN